MPPPALARPKPPSADEFVKQTEEAYRNHKPGVRDPTRYPMTRQPLEPKETWLGSAAKFLESIENFIKFIHGGPGSRGGVQAQPDTNQTVPICTDPDLCIAFVEPRELCEKLLRVPFCSANY